LSELESSSRQKIYLSSHKKKPFPNNTIFIAGIPTLKVKKEIPLVDKKYLLEKYPGKGGCHRDTEAMVEIWKALKGI
jgi:hypothetical protein